MSEVPEVPEGLGGAGSRLWREVYQPRPDGSLLVLRPDELVLLAELCALEDDRLRIRAELGETLLGTGSKGQAVAHPLRVELHRVTPRAESIVKTLSLPDDDAGGASWAGRNLARARWSG